MKSPLNRKENFVLCSNRPLIHQARWNQFVSLKHELQQNWAASCTGDRKCNKDTGDRGGSLRARSQSFPGVSLSRLSSRREAGVVNTVCLTDEGTEPQRVRSLSHSRQDRAGIGLQGAAPNLQLTVESRSACMRLPAFLDLIRLGQAHCDH